MLPQSRSSTLPTCGYEGISEVYGLGIRVGIYLQWMSGIICKDFLGEDALHDVLNENTIFLFAIFLATILLVTGTISGVHSVDILIMLHIFFGSIYTIFADERRVTARIEFFSSLIGILFKSGVATGMAAIGVWFWFYDIHVPADPTCSQYAFLFGRVGFYSPGTIKAFKAFSVINLMICGTCMLATIIVRINVWMYKAFLISKPFPAESLQERTKKPSLVVKLRRWVISGSLPAKKDYYEEYNALKLQSFREMEAKRKQAWSNGPAGTFGFSMTMGLLEGPIGSMILKNLLPDHVQEPLNVLSLDQKRQLLIEISGRPNLLKSFAAKRVRSPTFLSEREQSAILDDLSDRPELANFLAVLWDMSPLTQRSPRRATSKNGNEFGVVERICYLLGWWPELEMATRPYAVFVYSIVSIELLIRYNDITGVYTLLSTGQIIPFVIGIAGLWKVIWQIITTRVQNELAGSQKKETDPEGPEQETGETPLREQAGNGDHKTEQPVIASGALEVMNRV